MEPSNIEMNGINYEIKSLIEFSSLAKLLIELTKKQKEFETVYNNRISNLEIILKVDKNITNNNSITGLLNKAASTERSGNQEIGGSPVEANDQLSIKNDMAVLDDGLSVMTSDKKINPEQISKLFKRIKDLERRQNEIVSKINNEIASNIRGNKDNITSNKNQITDLNKALEEVQSKFQTFAEDFDAIKVKVKDFDIYDIFKGEAGEGGSIDASTALVKTLEQKVFKKFSLYDEKNKKNETDFFKAQEDVKNIKGLVDNVKMNSQRNIEKINELTTKLQDYILKNDNKVEELNTQLEELAQKVHSGPDFSKLQKEFNALLANREEEIKKLINDSILNAKLSGSADSKNSQSKEGFEALKDLNRKLNDLDKSVKQSLTDINIISIKDRISTLEKTMPKKVNENDFSELSEKTFALEEYFKDQSVKNDTLQQATDKLRSDMTQINKKIEFLNGEYGKLAFNNENISESKAPQIDTSSFVDINVFTDNKRDVSIKIERLKQGFEELTRNIGDINSTVGRLPNDKDFVQFQNVIKNMLDEIKISCHKKYADKYEISKNMKFLEAQIKSMTDTYKKMDGSDNWLLAKKPLNNYQCASCEALLKGDLDRKGEYVAWNKYPNREDKTYRMGHGFSRMLQMVNEEIIKNFENKDSKGYVSDEDKKYANTNTNNKSKYNDSISGPENKSLKLPKVKQRQPSNLNGNNNENYGLSVNKFGLSPSPYEDTDNLSPDENQPHVTKIYKVNNSLGNKKVVSSSGFYKSSETTIGGANTAANFNVKNMPLPDFQMNMTQPNEKK